MEYVEFFQDDLIQWDSDEEVDYDFLLCPICRAEHITDDRGARGFAENRYIIAVLEGKEKEFQRCPEHNREMTLFCRNQSCLALICSKCHLLEHKLHDVVDIDDEREENIKAIYEAKEVVNKGKNELSDVQEKMIEKLTTSLSEIEKRREYLKDTVDKVMNNYTKQCMEHHENNMRVIESNKALLEARVNKLESMKQDASNIREGYKFRMEPLQDIKGSVGFFSRTDGLKCLSYGNVCDVEKWHMVQLCGRITESEWSKGTNEQAANKRHPPQKGIKI